VAAVIAVRLLAQQLAVALLAGSGSEGHGTCACVCSGVCVSWYVHACVTHDTQLFKAMPELVSNILLAWVQVLPAPTVFRRGLLQCICARLFIGAVCVCSVFVRAFVNLRLRMTCGIRLLS